MTRLVRSFTLAVALLGLLTIAACAGDEQEGTPTTQATAAPTSATAGVGTIPATQATAAPTSATAGVGNTPAVEATATPTVPQGVAIEMGIDPETTGNTCGPSPADCTLGVVEKCYAVTCPSAECTWDGSSTFDGISDYLIDVYIDDPAGSAPAPAGYDAWVNYDQTKVHIAAPGTDGKIRMPGADVGGSDAATLPDSDGKFIGGWLFMATAAKPGVNTYIGNGPLMRLGLDIGASGLVTFSFDEVGSGYLSIGAGGWPAMQDHAVTFKVAQLAINQECPAE